MTAAAALIQLDDLPYHWTAGKGRVRKDEPLWAIVLYRIRADGLSEDDHAFVVRPVSIRRACRRRLCRSGPAAILATAFGQREPAPYKNR